MQCSESGAVSYKRDVANVLALDINPADATNKDELEEYKVSVPRPRNHHANGTPPERGFSRPKQAAAWPTFHGLALSHGSLFHPVVWQMLSPESGFLSCRKDRQRRSA